MKFTKVRVTFTCSREYSREGYDVHVKVTPNVTFVRVKIGWVRAHWEIFT
jgi:hypothetical protein